MNNFHDGQKCNRGMTYRQGYNDDYAGGICPNWPRGHSGAGAFWGLTIDTAGIANGSLWLLAGQFPEGCVECVAAPMGRLEHFADNDEGLNASLISDLAELRPVETLPLMERARAARRPSASHSESGV